MSNIIKHVNNGVITDVLKYNLGLSKITEAQTINLPNISTLQKTSSKTEVAKIVIAITKNGIDRFKVNNNMNEEDIITFAIDFIDKYYTDCVEDLAICFKYARQGRFGDVYRVDSHTVFQWYSQYLELKLEHKEKALHNKKQEAQEYAPDVKAGFAEIRRKLSDSREAETKEVVVDSFEKWWKQTKAFIPEMNKEEHKKLKELLIYKNSGGVYDEEIKHLNSFIKV